MESEEAIVYAAFAFIIVLIIAIFAQASEVSSFQSELSTTSALLGVASKELSAVSSALNQSNAAQQNLIGNYTKTQRALNAPGVNNSIMIWTIPQKLGPHKQTYWMLLDTFDNHIQITTNGTAEYLVLDGTNFLNFERNQSYVPQNKTVGTSFYYDERLSQGCSGYALVIWNLTNSTELITPNVYATYAPTPFLTGDCGTP